MANDTTLQNPFGDTPPVAPKEVAPPSVLTTGDIKDKVRDNLSYLQDQSKLFQPSQPQKDQQGTFKIASEDQQKQQQQIVPQPITPLPKPDVIPQQAGIPDYVQNFYKQQFQNIDNETTQAQSLLNQQQNLVSQQLQQTIQRINNLYSKRREDMTTYNKNVMGGLGVAGARTGRERYAPEIQAGLLSKEELNAQTRLKDLDLEEQNYIQQAQIAANQENFNLMGKMVDLAKQTRTEKEQSILKMYDLANQEDKKQMDKMKFQNDQMLQQFQLMQYGRTEQQQRAANIVPSVYGLLGDDMDKNAQVIQDYASKEGIDPSMLTSQIITYQREVQNEQLLNTQKISDVLAKTEKGGTVNVPGLGNIKILGKDASKPTTLETQGGRIMQWDEMGKKWADTGLKKDQMTQENIISGLLGIGKLFESPNLNPETRSLAESIAKSLGVKLPLPDVSGEPVEAFKASIQQQESGNYKAVNPDSGALGAYQIMPFHLPKIGLKNTPEDKKKFLSSPELQNKLYDKIVDDLSSRYGGDYQKMAAAYYGGDKGAQVVGTPAGDKPQGKYPSINDYVDKVINRMSAKSGKNLSDSKQIAKAIMEGKQPPDLKGLYGKSAGVRAELEKQGYDLTTAQRDWTGTQKYIATLNSTQQLRLKQATNFAYESLDLIDNLSSQWKRSTLQPLSKAKLEAAKTGALGVGAKSIATQLENQIADLQGELATVYRGGYAPTNETLKNSSKMLDATWDEKTLKDNVDLVRKNLKIRLNSMNVPPSGIGQEYLPESTTQTVGKSTVVTYQGKSYTFDSTDQAGQFKKRLNIK